MKKTEEPIVAHGWIKYTVKHEVADQIYRARLTDYPKINYTAREPRIALAECFADLSRALLNGEIKP